MSLAAPQYKGELPHDSAISGELKHMFQQNSAGRSEQTISNGPEGQTVRVSGSQWWISQRWSVQAAERYLA